VFQMSQLFSDVKKEAVFGTVMQTCDTYFGSNVELDGFPVSGSKNGLLLKAKFTINLSRNFV